MAISTDNGKLSVMEWCVIWEPGLPLSPGTIGIDDKQQLLWGFSELLWGGAIAFILDINTRLAVFLESYYAPALEPRDLTSMATRYLDDLTQPEMNARMDELIDDATS